MNEPVLRLLALSRPVAMRLALTAIAGAGTLACGIGLMATSAWLISRASERPPVLYLTTAIVAVRALSISRGLLRYGERLAGHDAALRVLGGLRVRCYERLERLIPARRRYTDGEVLSRLVSDVDTALDVLVRVVLPYAAAALAGAGAVTLLAVLLPATAAVVAAALIAVAVAVPSIQHLLARRTDRQTAPLRAELTQATLDLLRGAPDLIAYGAVQTQLARVGDADLRLRRAAARSSASVGLGSGLAAAAAGACVWASLVLATDAVRSGDLDGVLLAVVVLTPLAVFEAVAGLPVAAAQHGVARSALRRVFAVVDEPDPVPDPDEPLKPPPPPYRLQLQDVTARWPGQAADVFSHLSIDITPGRRIALVGPSGSGKSTTAALLVRFIDPTLGRVTLNDTDLRQLHSDDTRRLIGLVGDDAYCFDTTIEQNLRVARPDASPAELRTALRSARLLDWVESLPQGLATPVGERGARLSGGQRRRLAIARALLADFPILILDEPTEHLDEATARSLTEDLLASARTGTLVLITHRPYGLDSVDEILALPAAPALPP